MAKLHAQERDKLSSSTFGLPEKRKYPMPDKVHARVAKSYASKEEHAGKLSKSQESRIDSKANRMLHKGSIGAKKR